MDASASSTFDLTKNPLFSKTLIGILVSLLPLLQRKTGLQFSDADVQAIADNLLQIGGAIFAIYGRFTARTRLDPRAGASIIGVLALGAIFAVATGCAGSRLDEDFRSKVDGVTVNGSPAGVSGTVHFRPVEKPVPKTPPAVVPAGSEITPLGASATPLGVKLLHGNERGEYVWEEDGLAWNPDIAPSWRHTLYHEGQVIEPRVLLHDPTRP